MQSKAEHRTVLCKTDPTKQGRARSSGPPWWGGGQWWSVPGPCLSRPGSPSAPAACAAWSPAPAAPAQHCSSPRSSSSRSWTAASWMPCRRTCSTTRDRRQTDCQAGLDKRLSNKTTPASYGGFSSYWNGCLSLALVWNVSDVFRVVD